MVYFRTENETIFTLFYNIIESGNKTKGDV